MTPKTLFTIILKIFGLWLILSLILFIPTLFSIIPFMFQNDTTTLYLLVLVAIISIGIYVLIIWLLLFKTSLIINKLSLDKQFEQQTIDINISQKTVIQISIIIIGGLLIIKHIPLFISEIITYTNLTQFEEKTFENTSFNLILLKGMTLLIGYLLMNNSKSLTNWIVKKQENNNK